MAGMVDDGAGNDAVGVAYDGKGCFDACGGG